jgi:Leucine-rich repeat (LRR) protein
MRYGHRNIENLIKRDFLLVFLCLFISINSFSQITWDIINPQDYGLAERNLSTIVFDKQNNLWAAYANENGDRLGLVKFNGNAWTVFNSTNSGLPNNDVTVSACDKNGNLWFGCNNAGLIKFDGTTWTTYNTSNSSIAGNDIVAITFDSQNNVWVGAYGAGISKFNGISWTSFNSSVAPFPAGNCVNSIFTDRDDNVWVGLSCNGGLARLKTTDNTWTSFTTTNSQLPNDTITAIIQDASGVIWIGSKASTIASFDGINWARFPLDPTDYVNHNSVAIDLKGNAWIGKAETGLSRFKDGRWLKISPWWGVPSTIYNVNQSVAADHFGNIWWTEWNGGIRKRQAPKDIYIQDANFRQSLKANVPVIFDGDSIIDDLADDRPDVTCVNQAVQSIEGIQFFTSASTLFFNKNKISTIPDISALKNISWLSFEENQISSLPDLSANTALSSVDFNFNNIKTLPDLPASVEYISFSNNQIENIPDLSHNINLRALRVANNVLKSLPGFSSSVNLEVLDCTSNNLTSLPDFSQTKIGNVNYSHLLIANNYLTFEDIIPLMGKSYAEFVYSPQRTQAADAGVSLALGSNYTINLNIDNGVVSNVYKWYKDGTLLTTTSANQLTITNFDASKQGVYSALITNPNVPGLEIASPKTTLTDDHHVFIPDDNFRQCLKDNYPQAFDGDLLIIDSANTITHIECSEKNIASISGIEHFTSVNYLYFDYNNIQTIPDISMLTELRSLEFSFNAISSLPDISSNTKLSELHFAKNNFTVFPNIPANPNMTWVDFADNNIITVPDLSDLPNLTMLGIGYNPVESIGPLYKYQQLKVLDFRKTNLSAFPDLSQNVNLEEISFEFNPQFLTWPDLTANVNLTIINCPFNKFKSIPSLAAHTKLQRLICYQNQLDSLPDLSMLTQLETLECASNNLSSLPDLSQTKLGVNTDSNIALQISYNHLTFEDIIPVVVSKSYSYLEYAPQTLTTQNSVVQKNVGDTFIINIGIDNSVSTNIYTWYRDNVAIDTTTVNTLTINNLKNSDAGVYTCKISNTQITDITIDWGSVTLGITGSTTTFFIPDDNFRQCLKDSYPQAFDGDLLIVDSVKNITRIECYRKNITSIAGIENFTNARDLEFADNSIQTIPDISALTELQILNFASNAISSLPDITSNTKLLELHFEKNNFTVFPDITTNTNLTSVYFPFNSLTTIPDLSNLINLASLGVGYNPLASIGPLYKYQQLKVLQFGKTNLSSFPDLSQNINLEEISFEFNPQFLTWPDLTANINLTFIDCSFNNLKSIPSLAAHTKLNKLHCYQNQLDSLPDLSMLTQLEILDCADNNLSSLPDLSQTKLGIDADPDLSLRIFNNHLTFEDLIPVVVSKTYAYLGYTPQTLTTQNSNEQKNIGDTFIISTGIDNGVNTNVYVWYRDNVAIDTTTVNTLTINNLKNSDAGVYTCKISNTQITDITIDWGSVTLALTGSTTTLFIPDDNFRQCLKDSYPQMFIGELLIADSAKNIEDIGCGGRDIASIAGIENFTNATALNFGDNRIETIPDISALKELTLLDVRENELTSLPDLSQNTKLIQLICYANKFSVFPDLPVLPNLIFIEFSNNELASIPDLSHLASLDQLNIGVNPLTSIGLLPSSLRDLDFAYCNFSTFPDLSQNINLQHLSFSHNPNLLTWPDIAANINLTYIECGFNNFKSIPSLATHLKLKRFECPGDSLVELPDLSMLADLESLDCRNNNLKDLPDLSQTKLGKNLGVFLHISNNHLSFEDLIPIVSKSYTQLEYKPQTLPIQNVTISKAIGDTFSYDLGVDEYVSDNIYTWYHNDVQIATINVSTFSINKLKSSDAGVYTCKITNPEIPDITLDWKQITLTVTCPQPTLSETDFNVVITDATCVDGGRIHIKENGNGSLEGFKFELQNISSGISITSPSPVIPNLADGTYQLYFLAEGCSQQWPSNLLINKSNCDNPVFSPNNDGVADDYYIPHQGIAKIYDRNGVLISELSIPSVWNGTDSTGQPVPMGTYVITCSGQKDIFITIIR